jgi:hypothetical protein
VSEGFTTLEDRLQTDVGPAQEPEPIRALPGGSMANFRAAFSPHR